jgi:hypothetical protein
VGREVEQWLTEEVGGGPLFRLNKQELSEAVGRRRPLLVGRRDDRLLDPGESLADVFVQEAGRSLLVLGEPGSGKSVLLHRLAKDLLSREGAHEEPVPVLIDLAGWTDDGRPLIEWLASPDGLRRSYRSISDEQFRQWLRDGRLTLLMDGLDEVRAECRKACVEAINAFVGGAGGAAPGGLVVACRMDEYHAVAAETGPLDLSTAIYLQPLGEEQVRQYLASAGEHLQGLRAAWETDEAVRELARNPLMLRTMSLAFEASPPQGGDPSGGFVPPGASLRERLIEAYVARVFARAEDRVGRSTPVAPRHPPAVDRVFDSEPAWAAGETDALPFGREEVTRRLGWLARQLQAHARSTFYVEELQPSWLTPAQRRAYVPLSRGAGGLLLGVTGGLLLVLALGAGRTLFGLGEALLTGGLVLALSVGGALVVSGLDAYALTRGRPVSVLARVGGRAVAIAALGLLGGGLFWAVGLRGGYGLLFGVLWGTVVAVVFEPASDWRTATRDVRLVEPLRWSRRAALRAALQGLGWGALTGAGLGVGVKLLAGGQGGWGAIVVVVATAGALLGAVVGGALGGLRHGNVSAAPRHNLGLRLSIRNARFAGGVTAAAGALVVAALGLASGALGLGDAMLLGVAGGLFCGLLAALRHGGLNAVYHGTLRVLLARAGHLPRRSAPFFRFATDLSLMRSAGGGYAFAHRLFAEHFAAGEGEASGGVPSPPRLGGGPAEADRAVRTRRPRRGLPAMRDRG